MRGDSGWRGVAASCQLPAIRAPGFDIHACAGNSRLHQNASGWKLEAGNWKLFAMDPTIKDFESALAELDTIVRKMEEGELTLEKSMELYERGLQLSRFCHSTLEAAERRVELLNERGELRPAPAALGLGNDEEEPSR